MVFIKRKINKPKENFIKEVIKKAKVTPKGTPAPTKPINKGIEEQEQKGVITPISAAKR